MKFYGRTPYWARGAFVGVFFYAIFFLFQIILIPKYFYYPCGNAFCMNIFAEIVQNIYHITLFPLSHSSIAILTLNSQMAFNILALVYYFFVGSFFGLLYGKIRHGKDTIHPPI